MKAEAILEFGESALREASPGSERGFAGVRRLRREEASPGSDSGFGIHGGFAVV